MRKQPFLAFRHRDFRFYLLTSFLFTVAWLAQEVMVGYELYRMTGDPLAIGLLGLAHAAPYIIFSLVGGHLADLFPKKRLLQFSLGGILLCSATLYLGSRRLADGTHDTAFQGLVYGMALLSGSFYAFYAPTASALKAFLVPRSVYENAATWSSTAWQVGTVVGPGISGFIYSALGFSDTLLVVLVLMGIALFCLSQIREPGRAPAQEGRALDKIREGVRFVLRTRMLLHAISLDLFSVLFGGVIAILPVFAEDVLRVGPQGLGILRAAPSVGALLTLFVLSFLSLSRNAWRTLLLNVAGFGVATVVFALSRDFWLSVAALFLTGAFDAVSVVIRQTILLMLTPDGMRGRVGAVNGIFISASNELGAFESGLAASLLGASLSVVFGGGMALLVVAWVWYRTGDLMRVDLRQAGQAVRSAGAHTVEGEACP
jgi:MFS family permease